MSVTRATLASFGEDLTLPNRSVVGRELRCLNTNTPGNDWVFTQNGEFQADPGNFVQFLHNGDRGWHDCILKVGEKGQLLRTRHNDPSYVLDAPWWNGSSWRSGYYRVWRGAPIGTWFNEVWPRAGMTIRTNYSEITVFVDDSPSESLVVFGNNNRITVKARSGEQSRLMQTRAAVVINGHNNVISGFVEHPMTALYIRGNNNGIEDFVAVGTSLGDDASPVYIEGKGYNGTWIKNVQSICAPRVYEAKHLITGFYIDDMHSSTVCTNCLASGFMHGYFSHGGNNQKVTNFKSIMNTNDVTFARHFTTPDTPVRDCSVRQVSKLY